MRKLILFTLMTAPLWAYGQNSTPISDVRTDGTQITINAKGTDVRGVLHELFTQAKKNYVLENVPRIELFLSLTSLDFEETLEIVCRIANLRYEVQNGIYYLSKNRPTTAAANRTPAPANPATTAVAPVPAPSVAPKLTGRLPQSVLQRSVKGTFNRLDLRTIARRLGEMAKVTVEIDERVPRYRLDFTLNTTSLGFALRTIAQRLDLEMVFTDSQTILLRPKQPAEVVEKFEVSTDQSSR